MRRVAHLRSADATIDCGVSSTPKRFFGALARWSAVARRMHEPRSAGPPFDNALRRSILTASIPQVERLAPADALHVSAFHTRIFNVPRECAVRCGKNRGCCSAFARRAFDRSCRGRGRGSSSGGIELARHGESRALRRGRIRTDGAGGQYHAGQFPIDRHYQPTGGIAAPEALTRRLAGGLTTAIPRSLSH